MFLALGFTAAAPAFAVYPPSPGGIGVSTTNPASGEPFTVAVGVGTFAPGSTVTWRLTCTPEGGGSPSSGSGTATGTGSFSNTFTIDGNRDCRVTLTSGSVTESISVTIGSGDPGGGGGGGLAPTGADRTLQIAAIGGALVLLGGGAVFLTRRREKSLG